MNSKPAVGVIGLGAMGEPIAGLLLKAGVPVAVYDIRDEPVRALHHLGATPCASAAEVAGTSDIIVTLVLDEAQTRDTVFGGQGVLTALRPGAIVAIGSTIGAGALRDIDQALEERRADTLDVPISGGLVAARAGTLSMMAGGKREVLERALPILRAFARDITYTGDVGSGQTAKLAHQLVFGLHVMALLEGLALGAAGGVKPEVLKQIFNQGLAGSKVLDHWPELGARWKSMLRPTAPGVPTPNLRKDLHLVLDLGRELGMPLQLGALASTIADAGQALGYDNPDF